MQELNSALYLHCESVIPLGRPQDDLWPFSSAIQFVTDPNNSEAVNGFVSTWKQIRKAYIARDRESQFYYVANASGHPPKTAKEDFDWPAKESISDSKTSAGMDRTDDIKKGIYQTLKLGIEANREFGTHNIKTALITNLPAYRHGKDYVDPFHDIYWGFDSSFAAEENSQMYRCSRSDLKRPFDYIIALEDAFLRDEAL